VVRVTVVSAERSRLMWPRLRFAYFVGVDAALEACSWAEDCECTARGIVHRMGYAWVRFTVRFDFIRLFSRATARMRGTERLYRA
jgi:hypothetical protein